MRNSRNTPKLFILVFLGLLLLSSAWCQHLDAATHKNTAHIAFERARNLYKALMRSTTRQKYRCYWIDAITAYRKVYVMYPGTSYAFRSRYMVGKLYLGLYKYSRKPGDLDTAEEAFRTVIRKHPRSYLADDAQYKLGEIYEIYRHNPDRALVEYSLVEKKFPKGDMVKAARAKVASLKKMLAKKAKLPAPRTKTAPVRRKVTKPVAVKDIRHWSSKDYTRVVIDLTGPVNYTNRILPEDKKYHKPVRICLDLENTYVPKSFKSSFPIGDGLLQAVRIGQFSKKIVRVVLDTQTLVDYKIFTLEDPFRIVIDALGNHSGTRTPPLKPKVSIPRKIPNASLVQQLGLGIKTIVIDPGHGGRDCGAIGYRRIKEKKVVLAIAKRLKEEIKKRHPHMRVILTRYKDRYISLEERTAIANTRKADLFVSIHANAHRNRRVSGVETFFLNFATDEEAVRVAALENATSRKSISDLQSILHDLMLNSKIAESSNLAYMVQRKLVRRLRSKFRHVRDHGVKQAPFYVLIGAKMPAILVETSYISNPMEAKRLNNSRYQREIAKGIADGIDAYISQIHSLALGS